MCSCAVGCLAVLLYRKEGHFFSLSDHIIFCEVVFIFRVPVRAVCGPWKRLPLSFSVGTLL